MRRRVLFKKPGIVGPYRNRLFCGRFRYSTVCKEIVKLLCLHILSLPRGIMRELPPVVRVGLMLGHRFHEFTRRDTVE